MSAELVAENAGLSKGEARKLTDEVKGDAERLWQKLNELYEGGAHLALGYSSWGAYFKAEFGRDASYAYRLLQSGRVMAQLPIGSRPANEAQARELAPLLNDPPALEEAWAEVTELTPEPTAAAVREVVQQKVGLGHKATINANAAKRRLVDALSSISGYCGGFADFNLERALSNASPEEVADWDRLASESIRALNSLRRSIKEGT